METKFWKLNKGNDTEIFNQAGELIRQGELVAFPTETVYGLGANGLDEIAVKKIFLAKGRPSDNPLILHIADINDLNKLAKNISPMAKKLAEKFWPGPMTLVVEKSDIIPDVVSVGLNTVAIRFPSNIDAQKLILAAKVPIAAPSANLSGKPSPTNANDVWEDMQGKIAAILDGGDCQVGLESTVIDTTGDVAIILRPGQITPQMLKEFLGDVDLDRTLKGETTAVPKAPGMKYRHYAPKAEMYLCKDKNILQKNVNVSLSKNLKVGVIAKTFVQNCENKIFNSVSELANKLFFYLRELDRAEVDIIYAEMIDEQGLGFAVMNRMKKAAGGKILS